MDSNFKNDRLALSEGTKIFQELRAAFPDYSTEHFDIVLNSLCFALTALGTLAVQPGKKHEFINLVNHILQKNLKDE